MLLSETGPHSQAQAGRQLTISYLSLTSVGITGLYHQAWLNHTDAIVLLVSKELAGPRPCDFRHPWVNKQLSLESFCCQSSLIALKGKFFFIMFHLVVFLCYLTTLRHISKASYRLMMILSKYWTCFMTVYSTFIWQTQQLFEYYQDLYWFLKNVKIHYSTSPSLCVYVSFKLRK